MVQKAVTKPHGYFLETERLPMTTSTRIVLSSDHAAIALRQVIKAHVTARGWVAVDVGPVTAESTHYPAHGEAAARRVASRKIGVRDKFANLAPLHPRLD